MGTRNSLKIEGMMKCLSLILVLAISSVASSKEVSDMWKAKLSKFNLYTQCFGFNAVTEYFATIHKATEYCHQISSPVDLTNEVASLSPNEVQALRDLFASSTLAQLLNAGRKKRQVDGLAFDFNDIAMLRQGVEHYKEKMSSVIGNVSCVLTQMDIMDSTGQINRDHFSYNSVRNYMAGTDRRGDEDLIQAFTTGYQDCMDISRNWPQTTLDRHPMMKAYCRQALFVKCMLKVEENTCYRWQIYTGLNVLFGLDVDEVDLGIPHGNKYEKAEMVRNLMYKMASHEEQAIEDMFWGDKMHM